MKLEDKIRDILNRHYGYEVMAGSDVWFSAQYQDRFAHLLELAEWKDEQAKLKEKQLLEKACEWLKENIYHRVYECGDKLGFPTADFIEDFKKAMEE